jgi:hypothetical protein
MDQEQPSGERPEGWSSSIRHRSAAAAPKLPTPYHLMLQREKLLTSGFHTPTKRTERCRSSVVREAWTDIGDVGAGRRSDLRRDETFSQMSTTLGWTPPANGSTALCSLLGEGVGTRVSFGVRAQSSRGSLVRAAAGASLAKTESGRMGNRERRCASPRVRSTPRPGPHKTTRVLPRLPPTNRAESPRTPNRTCASKFLVVIIRFLDGGGGRPDGGVCRAQGAGRLVYGSAQCQSSQQSKAT